MVDLTLHPGLEGPNGEKVWVKRSPRRRKTVSISRHGGDLVVSVPARFSKKQEAQWVPRMVERLGQREARTSHRATDDVQLRELADELNRTYFGGELTLSHVSWSSRQLKRWGSCTPAEGTIRLSARLQTMPRYVVEAVLVHELAHLIVDDHSAQFKELVARYPHSERAEAFLAGVTWATDHGLSVDADQSECAQEGAVPES